MENYDLTIPLKYEHPPSDDVMENYDPFKICADSHITIPGDLDDVMENSSPFKVHILLGTAHGSPDVNVMGIPNPR